MADLHLSVVTRSDGAIANPGIIELVGPNETYRWATVVAQPGNPEPPHNSTMNTGWNLNQDGNAEVEGEPVLRDTWEANAINTGAGGYRLMKRHIQYTGADGVTTRRVLSISIDRSDHRVYLGFFDAPPVQKPTVNGSWSDGSAGASLVAALAALGLVTNATTP